MHLRISIGLVVLMLVAVPSGCSAATLHTHLSHEAFAAREVDDISGEWDVSFKVQGMTTPATFNLKLDGRKVTGTVNSEHTGPGTIRDGSWVNNKLSFTLDFKKHESIVITGTLKDGKLTGEFRTEGFVSNWEAVKKPTAESGGGK